MKIRAGKGVSMCKTSGFGVFLPNNVDENEVDLVRMVYAGERPA